MKLTAKQQCLFKFVKVQHGEQKRKYTGEPYWNHLYNVAEIAYDVNENLIEVALCHDLFEDTKCSEAMLLQELISLGYNNYKALDIVRGVIDLTDVYTKESYPLCNRAERKKLEAERLATICEDSQTIKYCDLIDNTKSITQHDVNFAKTYLIEKKFILSIMDKGNSVLYEECLSIIK